MASATDSRSDDGPLPLACTVVALDGAGGTVVVRVDGALDARTAGSHATELTALVEDGAVELHIDLDGLVLCTSDGLDVWDDVQHRLDPLGGHLTLRGATGVVRRVLDVATSSPTHFCPTVLPA